MTEIHAQKELQTFSQLAQKSQKLREHSQNHFLNAIEALVGALLTLDLVNNPKKWVSTGARIFTGVLVAGAGYLTVVGFRQKQQARQIDSKLAQMEPYGCVHSTGSLQLVENMPTSIIATDQINQQKMKSEDSLKQVVHSL